MRELEKEREREVLESSGSKEKKKWRGCTNDRYTCVVDKKQEKKGNIWMKERKNNHNIFTINL